MIPAGGAEWALVSEAVFTPEGFRPAAVLVRGETIAAVVNQSEVPADLPVRDVGLAMLLPGLVDAHVHVNEPGRADWEGFETATKAALAGGVTTIIDMPLNSSPVTTTAEALRRKREAAAGKLWVDVGFHAGVVPGNAGDVPALLAAGVCGFKAFLCHSGLDEFPAATEADLRAVMPALAAAGVPLLAHAELVSPLPRAVEEHFAANPRGYAAYLATRPAAWEVEAVALLIRLCREYRCPVHIVHLAAATEAWPLIEAAKREGLPLTVETCPHYLTFAAEDVPDGDPRFKCAPPIRPRDQRQLLRELVGSGRIDTVGSDHSPAPPGLKHLIDGDLRRAWGGIASLQLLLAATWTAVDGEQTLRALTARPAELVGLAARKGSIAAGLDADLVVFDPYTEAVVDASALHHRHKPTPYDGRRLRGRVETTYLRGQRVYHRGMMSEQPPGRLLERPLNR